MVMLSIPFYRIKRFVGAADWLRALCGQRGLRDEHLQVLYYWLVLKALRVGAWQE
jgi:hypothetical protein